jgi:hypothetical protein
LFTRRDREKSVAPHAAWAIIAFAAVSYLVWLKMFGIYRYILLLEILAPVLIAICIGLWPIAARSRMIVAGIVFVIVLCTMRTESSAHAPLAEPYIQVTVPKIAHPDKTMILMTGETPMGYLAPSLPHQISILRIDGWMIKPTDGSLLTIATKARVARFTGDLYVIFSPTEAVRNKNALANYGLAIRAADCRNIVTNLDSPYGFCPLTRLIGGTP